MSFENIDDDREEAAHERRIKRCRSCNGKVIWFKTAGGKNMPVDEGTVEAGEYELDLKRHKSHFSTCPQAAEHRRPR